MFDTPVLLIVFNRPDTTAAVLGRILQAGTRNLFIAADGPRPNWPDDEALCRRTRELTDRVGAGTKVHKLVRAQNLGCRVAVSSAISWFFSQVEEGIILEDDCLPDPSFFPFCQALLKAYAEDPRVKIVSGQNPFGIFDPSEDVIFSKYAFIWGWATWRRTWKEYDLELRDWPSNQAELNLRNWLRSRHAMAFWRAHFDAIKEGFNTWDIQLNYMMYRTRGFAAVSGTNLVKNIGFSAEATHTGNPADARQFLPVSSARNPIEIPRAVTNHTGFDRRAVRELYYREEITVRGTLKKWLKVLYRKLRR